MSDISCTNSYDLGNWSYLENQLYKPKNATIKIGETIELSVRPIDKNSNLPGEKQILSSTHYEYLLGTKSPSILSCLFVPPRTHSVKDVILDLLVPLSRRLVTNVDITSGSKVVLLIVAFVADLLTLFIRAITIIPKMIYNAVHSHSMKKVLDPQYESWYVKCEKKWNVILENDDGSKSSEIFSKSFYWRVDLVAPLYDHFFYEGERHVLNEFDDVDKPFCKIISPPQELSFSSKLKENAKEISFCHLFHCLTAEPKLYFL